MGGLTFKNGILHPIKIPNHAHVVSYVKSQIYAEARNILLNQSGSPHHGPRPDGNG